MTCPSCGTESSDQLKFCKRCGASLNAPTAAVAPGKFPAWLVIFFLMLIGFISVIGLTIPLAASNDLARSGFSTANVMQIFMASALAVLTIDGLLVWLLLRLVKLYQQAGAAAQSPAPPRPALRESPPAQIVAPPESVASVTENTTRNFAEYENLRRARGPHRDAQ